MSIVTECQFCNEPTVCYVQQTDDSSVLICDGCREESTQCTSCGVITDYYEYDKDGFIECLDCIDKSTPKQVTKAPQAGAAVSAMPLHEAVIPLDKSVTAEYMANHARNESIRSLGIARQHRLEGDRASAAFFLNDAAEFRRIYMAFAQAVDVMGGL